MQRGFSALILLILIAVLAAIGVFYIKSFLDLSISMNYPSPFVVKKEQNTLKTYTNNTFGFEFNYPKNLEAKVDSEENYSKRNNGEVRKNFAGYVGYQPGGFLAAVSVIDNSSKTPFEDSPFSLWVFDNPNNLDESAWFNKYWYYPFNWGQFESSEKIKIAPSLDATIGGQLARYGVVSYSPGKPKFIYLNEQALSSGNKDGKMYLFRVLTDPNQIGDQILSSFKFLNNPKNYICPKPEFTNCFTDKNNPTKNQCSDDYLKWAKANCPAVVNNAAN
ncbi:hypothetical protein HY025_01570 [Candidatus Daviesbacteria bacterium]|nr:hypothetical protein [Candidatus Daviesbacteria bacterium]